MSRRKKRKKQQQQQQAKEYEFNHPGVLGDPYYRVHKTNELIVSRAYQRPLSQAWINRTAKNWSDHLCGAIIVAKRPNGKFYVIDGQQRLEAAKIADVKKIRCMIFLVDGKPATEAHLFSKINKERTSLKPYDLYKSDLVTGVEDAVLVDDICSKLDYEVMPKGGSTNGRSVICIQKMRHWAKRDPQIFEDGMEVAAKLSDGKRIDNRLVSGLCYLEHNLKKVAWKESAFSTRNVTRLKRAGLTKVFQFMEAAVMTEGASANNVPGAQANGLIRILNSGRRRDNRIPLLQV